MKGLKEARQRVAELRAEDLRLASEGHALYAAAQKEGRDLTSDEIKAEQALSKREGQLEKDMTEAQADLERAERANERERRMGTERDGNTEAVERALGGGANPWAALAMKEGRSGAKISGRLPFEDTTRVHDMTGFGDQLQAIYLASVPGNRSDPRLIPSPAGTFGPGPMRASVSGLSEGVPTDGGFLLQPEYAAGILTKMYSMGEILSRVEKIPIGPGSNSLRINAIDETSRVNGSRWGGLVSAWLGEGSPILDGKPKFRQMELVLKKVAALYYATDELLQDATALEAILMRALPEELDFRVEDAVWEGTGAGMPLGIMSAPALITVAEEVGQATATVVYENIEKMWSRMWAPSRKNAVWFINQDVEPQLFSLSLKIGTAGAPVWLPAGGISGSPYSTLFGRPVVPVEYASTVGTAGDIMLADPSQYQLIDKGGVQSAMSIHVRFIYDESTFRFIYRVDGQPGWGTAPLTPFKGNNTLSPYVVLATRS